MRGYLLKPSFGKDQDWRFKKHDSCYWPEYDMLEGVEQCNIRTAKDTAISQVFWTPGRNAGIMGGGTITTKEFLGEAFRIVEATLVSCLMAEKVLLYKELDLKYVTEKKIMSPWWI